MLDFVEQRGKVNATDDSWSIEILARTEREIPLLDLEQSRLLVAPHRVHEEHRIVCA